MSDERGRTRNTNDGLWKKCGCSRHRWTKCKHGWYFNFKLEAKDARKLGVAAVPIKKNLDDVVGHHVTSKTEAENEVERLRTALRAGELVIVKRPVVDTAGVQARYPNGELRYRLEIAAPAPVDEPKRETLTLERLLHKYVAEYVTHERPRSLAIVGYQVKTICTTPLELFATDDVRAFGDWHVRDVTTGAIEQYRNARRGSRVVTVIDKHGEERRRRKGGTTATNRELALLRAAFNWAIRTGWVDQTPFKRNTETVVKLTHEANRRRRLEGEECERLLAACDPILRNPKTREPMFPQPRPRLRPLVEAAIESGCRVGELLSLQWWQVKDVDVDGASPWLDLPASKTKTKRDRVVPVSSRLKAILEMRRNDPDGEPHKPQAFVFGNEVGERTASIKTAWRLTCRRAGIEDLHFHDLRREAGSRWLEGGVPLQVVRDWLGHANISQTSTYLGSTAMGQQEAMRRFEEMRSLRAMRQAALEEEKRKGNNGIDTRPGRGPRDTDTNKNPQRSVN